MQFSTTTNIRIFLILSLLTCLTVQLTAQKLPMKWGAIPDEDFKMTTYEADPEADAVILGHYASIEADLSRQYEVSYDYHIRMKILTKEGVDRASETIPYYKKEKITGFKAHTINGSKVTKVDKKDMFDEKVTGDLYRKNFAFSDVQVGSIIEYKYTLQSENFGVLDNWYFQEDIPVRHSECRFMIPEYLEYAIVTNLDREFDEKTNKNTSIGNFSATIYRFVMKNVDARKEEPFITTMNDYLNNIKFQLSLLKNPFNGIQERFMHDWPNLIKLWWEHESGGKQVKNKMNHKKILKDAELATLGITGQEEIAKALYKFIQNSYNWDGRFSDYVYEKKLNTAYEKKAGNSAAINLSLLACLQDAGIEAYPIRISTRGHGKIQKIYPIVQQFNHIVVLAKINGKDYLLDAIQKDLTFGMLFPSSLNGEGLVMQPKQKTHEWIPLKPAKTTEVVNINLKLDDDEPTAELTGVYTGYRALRQRMLQDGSDEEDYIENRLGDLYDFEVESVEFNIKKPERFAEVIKLKVADAVTVAPDIIYIDPLLMERTDERTFTSEKRTYPVDIAYPYSEKYILNITIPEGYEVETKPDNVKLVLPDKSGEYLYMIEAKNNILQLRCEESLKKPIYFPQEYESLKEFFDMIFDKEAEQIVLKKKA